MTECHSPNGRVQLLQSVPAYVRFDHEFHARATSDVTPGMVLWGALGLAFCGWVLWQGLHEIARVLGIGG